MQTVAMPVRVCSCPLIFTSVYRCRFDHMLLWPFLADNCITLISHHRRRLTTVILSSSVSAKCPFATHVRTEGYTHAHTCAPGQSQSAVSCSVSPHVSSPLLSAVTYQPATSAARHLLSESLWRPFNPPSKEVFPVNEGKRDPNTKDGGGRGGRYGENRREDLAE